MLSEMGLNSLAILLIFVPLLVVSLFVNFIPLCSAQTTVSGLSGIQIDYEMYNWTSDMNRLAMTTQPTGLIFEIVISNKGTEPLMIGYSNYNSYYPYSTNNIGSLSIYIQVQGSDTQNSPQPQTISFSSNNKLYLPPNTSESFYVEFDQYGNSLPIGSYTAKVSYYLNSDTYGNNGLPIGQYPFNFQIESSQTLKDAIAKNPQGSGITLSSVFIMIIISAVLGGVISVGITYYISSKTRFLNKGKRKYQFFGSLATALMVLFGAIGLYLQYLQLIKL